MYWLPDTNSYFSEQGVSQAERLSRARQKSSDLFGWCDPLSYLKSAEHLSALMVYYNQSNAPDGDWMPFFRNHQQGAVLLLATLYSKELHAKFSHHLEGIRSARDRSECDSRFFEFLDLIIQELVRLDRLWMSASHKELGEHIGWHIENGLSTLLVGFLEGYVSLKGIRSAQLKARHFSKAWSLDSTQFNIEGKSFSHEILSRESAQLLNVFQDIGLRAKEVVDTQLLESGKLAPHLSMFYVFANMNSNSLDSLANLPEAYIKSIYQDRFGFELRGNSSDTAFFQLTFDDPDQPVLLTESDVVMVSTAEELPLRYQINRNQALSEHKIETLLLVDGASKKVPVFQQNESADLSYVCLASAEHRDHPTLGFRISTEHLILTDGDRFVRLEFTVEKESLERGLAKLDMSGIHLQELSDRLSAMVKARYDADGEEVWITEDNCDASFSRQDNSEDVRLTFGLVIDRSAPEPIPTSEEDKWPAIDILYHTDDEEIFRLLTYLNTTQLKLRVDLIEVAGLSLQNEFGVIPKGVPFEPFGSAPVLGTRFYIGHPKLFSQPLIDLKLNIEWLGLPLLDGGFAEYYEGYHGISGNDDFKVAVSALRNKRWVPREDRQIVDLFQDAPEEVEGEENRPLSRIRRINEIDLWRLELQDMVPVERFEELNVDTRSGYLALELVWPQQAFGHEEYPELMREVAMKRPKRRSAPPRMPNPPFTPVIKTFTVDAGFEVVLNRKNSKITTITPFDSFWNDTGALRNSVFPDFSAGSTMYFGIQAGHKLAQLSLLLVLDSPYEKRDFSPQWSVLSEQGWLMMADGDILFDGTNQLQQTGILELNVAKYNPLRCNERYWIRLTCKNELFFSDVIANAQGSCVSAHLINPEFRGEEAIGPDFNCALEKRRKGLAGVALMQSPHGGRDAESWETFKARVSEYFRHRGRALSNFDITSIILSEFPEVHVAKCVNHANGELNPEPGAVVVTLLPNDDLLRNGNRLTYFSHGFLKEVESFLVDLMPAGINVSVINPKYEKVRLKFNIVFHEGFDEKYFVQRLEEELIEYLNPWSKDNSEGIRFGDVVESAIILNWLENRPYVDHVLNFSTLHLVDGSIRNFETAGGANTTIRPSTAVSVLVSDNTHDIFVMDRKEFTDKSGINEMMVETDFIVNQKTLSEELGVENVAVGIDFVIGEEDFTETEVVREFNYYT